MGDERDGHLSGHSFIIITTTNLLTYLLLTYYYYSFCVIGSIVTSHVYVFLFVIL